MWMLLLMPRFISGIYTFAGVCPGLSGSQPSQKPAGGRPRETPPASIYHRCFYVKQAIICYVAGQSCHLVKWYAGLDQVMAKGMTQLPVFLLLVAKAYPTAGVEKVPNHFVDGFNGGSWHQRG